MKKLQVLILAQNLIKTKFHDNLLLEKVPILSNHKIQVKQVNCYQAGLADKMVRSSKKGTAMMLV